MSKWTVRLIGQAKKYKKILPLKIQKNLILFIAELGNGPNLHTWPNYGKLGKSIYHCHLKKGRPTYVACWTADKSNKIIEVFYAGTHEKAPY